MVKKQIKNVLFVTTEAQPFASTGGMGEVCSSLPRALNATGKADARIIMPLYAEAAALYKDRMQFVCNITVGLAWRNQYCGLFRMEHNGVTYYFVDNEYYFKRNDIYGYYDDAERFAFFSRAAWELMPHLGFKPDVVQSNDHLTALVPIYYTLEYGKRTGYGGIKNVYTVIDTEEFDPATSRSLFVNYDADTLDRKRENKLGLQRMLALPEDPDVPMLCMISHLANYKGFDLLRKSINKVGPSGNLLDTNIQLVILGRGDADIEGYLDHIQKMYDRRVRLIVTHSPDLAQKVLAAADMCLMPSRTEPCGLMQMYACRFGTVPIVRATGGLLDSITDCEKHENGNGFMFEEYDSDVMDRTITRAVSVYYYHKDEWRALQKRGMACDYSWSKAAASYVKLYNSL